MKEPNEDELKKFLRAKKSEEANPQFKERMINQIEQFQSKSLVKRHKIRLSIFAAAASFVLFALVFVLVNQGSKIEIIDGKPTVEGNHIFTMPDKTASVKLEDKTQVDLMQKSAIRILDRRSLEFVDGQVTFDVAKDGPFSVKTKQAVIKVLGTRFELKLEDEKLCVHVFSGQVSVENSLGQQTLGANDAATCLLGAKPAKVQSKLEELRALIKKLGDNDVETREKSKEAIIKLIREEAKAKKNIKELLAELKKTMDETKDEEIKSRIPEILDNVPHDDWFPISKFPLSARKTFGMCIVRVDEKLIMWGGTHTKDEESKFCTDGAIYDIKQDKWEKIPEAPIEGRRGFPMGGGDLTSKLIGTNLIIWGGFDIKGKNLHDGAIYDIKENKWKKLPDLPFKQVISSTLLVCNDNLVVWLSAGDTVKTSKESGVIYDFKENKWDKIPDVPFEKRIGFSKFFVDGKLLIWGGKTSNSLKYFNEGVIYDIKAGKWKKISDAPFYSTSQFQTIISGDKLILYGYFSKNNFSTWKGVMRNCSAIYDVTKDAWSDIFKAPIADEDFYPNLYLVGDKLVAWGSTAVKMKPKSYGAIFDLKENKWRKLPEFPLEQRRSALVLMADNNLIVWGGTNHIPMPNDFTPAPPGFKDGAIYSIKEDKWRKLPDLQQTGDYCEYVPSLKQLILMRGGSGVTYDLSTILSLTE